NGVADDEFERHSAVILREFGKDALNFERFAPHVARRLTGFQRFSPEQPRGLFDDKVIAEVLENFGHKSRRFADMLNFDGPACHELPSARDSPVYAPEAAFPKSFESFFFFGGQAKSSS